MRVISGEARGRKFLAPAVQSVRPTSDRVREAIFDVLSHLGGFSGARVLDLFAGSGAFGIESLSRGASSVVFVDQDHRVTRVVRENLAAVRLELVGTSQIVTSDAIAFCRRLADLQHREQPATTSPDFDIAFCDPPYAFSNWAKLLKVIPGNLVVLESAKAIELPGHLELYRVYRYGSTLVTVAHRREITDENALVGPVGDDVRVEVIEPTDKDEP